jgi:hypothetical protein
VLARLLHQNGKTTTDSSDGTDRDRCDDQALILDYPV